MKQAEVWRPVVGFEGRYEVSNLGRVRSVAHPVVRANRWGGFTTAKYRGKILTPVRHDGGYIRVCFGKSQTYAIHLLVAAAFLGPRPKNQVVRHLNGCSDDSALRNLEYGTPQENIQDSKRHGTWQKGIQKMCKVHPRKRDLVLGMYQSGGYTLAAIGRKFGVTATTIMRVVRGRHADNY